MVEFRLFGGTIRTALVHAAAESDRKAEARALKRRSYYNHYALGHMLGRIDEVCADIDRGASPRAALLAAFNDRLLDTLLEAIGEKPAERGEKTNLVYHPVAAPQL